MGFLNNIDYVLEALYKGNLALILFGLVVITMSGKFWIKKNIWLLSSILAVIGIACAGYFFVRDYKILMLANEDDIEAESAYHWIVEKKISPTYIAKYIKDANENSNVRFYLVLALFEYDPASAKEVLNNCEDFAQAHYMKKTSLSQKSDGIQFPISGRALLGELNRNTQP